jgi:hypothetical protein
VVAASAPAAKAAIFVTCMHPTDRAEAVEACGQAIQAVTGNTPYFRHACRSECFGEMIGNRSGHDVVSFFKND